MSQSFPVRKLTRMLALVKSPGDLSRKHYTSEMRTAI